MKEKKLKKNKNFQAIKKILAENFGVCEKTVLPEAKLTTDLNLSQLEKIDFLSFLAKEFNFSLPEEIDFTQIETVNDVLTFLEENVDDV